MLPPLRRYRRASIEVRRSRAQPGRHQPSRAGAGDAGLAAPAAACPRTPRHKARSRIAAAGSAACHVAPAVRCYGDRVEDIDRQIVALLSRAGRLSFTDLAKRTGLSVSAAHQRVRRLEKRGVIKGYVALVGMGELGLPLTAFVSIKPFDAAAPDDAPRTAGAPGGDRGMSQRRKGGELHPQGACCLACRPRGTAAADQGGGGIHPDHDRAEHALRESRARPVTPRALPRGEMRARTRAPVAPPLGARG